MAKTFGLAMFSFAGTLFAFALLRYLGVALVVMPMRSIAKRHPVLMPLLAVVLCSASAAGAIAVARLLGAAIGLNTSDAMLTCAAVCIVALFGTRLAFAATPDGIDPAVYDSDWKPDPDRSDEWNLSRRIALDRQTKAWSFVGVLFGFGAMLYIRHLFVLEPLLLRFACIYLLVGVVVAAFHLGCGMVGAKGIAATITACLTLWPLLVLSWVPRPGDSGSREVGGSLPAEGSPPPTEYRFEMVLTAAEVLTEFAEEISELDPPYVPPDLASVRGWTIRFAGLKEYVEELSPLELEELATQLATPIERLRTYLRRWDASVAAMDEITRAYEIMPGDLDAMDSLRVVLERAIYAHSVAARTASSCKQ